MANYIIQSVKMFPYVKEKGSKSILKVGVWSGNNFLTNVCDFDIVSPKFGTLLYVRYLL